MFGRLRARSRRIVVAVAVALAAPLLAVTPAAAAGYTFKALKCTALPANYAYDAEITRSGYSMLVAGNKYVSKLDVTKNPAKVLGTTTAAWGRDLAIHANRVVAYVASRDSDTLFVLDIAGNTPKVVRTIPIDGVSSVATSNDGKYLYVGSSPWAGSYFRAYSTAKPTAPVRLASLQSTYGIGDVAVAPNGKSAVFSNSDRATLVRLADPKKPVVVKHIALPYYTGPVTYTRDSNSIYVGASGQAVFSRIDVGTRRVVSTRTIGQVSYDGITDLEPSSDNKLIWVTTDSDDTENSTYAFGIKSGSLHFLGGGVYGPQAAAVSPAGLSKGRVYFPSSIDKKVCGVKQTPN